MLYINEGKFKLGTPIITESYIYFSIPCIRLNNINFRYPHRSILCYFLIVKRVAERYVNNLLIKSVFKFSRSANLSFQTRNRGGAKILSIIGGNKGKTRYMHIVN